MKKHISILIAFILVLSLTLGGIFIMRLLDIGNNYLNHLEISYRGALGELSDNLETTALILNKLQYSSGDTVRHKGLNKIISACSAAKSGAAALPFSAENSSSIEKLLSVTMDYSSYLSSKIARGEKSSDEEMENLKELAYYIERLKVKTNEIRMNLGYGIKDGSISKVLSLFSANLDLPPSENFDSALKEFGEESKNFEGLIYDGPFSSHIERKEALYLKNKEEITAEKAIEIAADFLDTDKSLLKCEFETEGNLAAFEITGENVKSLVTKKGGEISFAKKTGDWLENNLGYDEALNEALEFLEESGFKNLKETSFVINDNTCTINFCPFENGITFYPDLIKITVELKEGKMVEYEAEGYLLNHRVRENFSPALKEEEIKALINENLNIKEISLALIPTEGENEVLCYEVLSEFTDEKGEKTEVLSYLNAENGSEEQIYIIDRAENHLYLN